VVGGKFDPPTFRCLGASEASQAAVAERPPDIEPQPEGGEVANRPGANESQGIRDAFWLHSMQSGHRNAYECIAAFSATDVRKDLDSFDVRTLVIHGDDDQVVPFEVGGKASATRIQGAKLGPRVLGHAQELGGLGRPIREARVPRADPGVPRA